MLWLRLRCINVFALFLHFTEHMLSTQNQIHIHIKLMSFMCAKLFFLPQKISYGQLKGLLLLYEIYAQLRFEDAYQNCNSLYVMIF